MINMVATDRVEWPTAHIGLEQNSPKVNQKCTKRVHPGFLIPYCYVA
jgi:hypothetical protein